MIIYGTSSKVIKRENINGHTCANCANTNTTSVTIYSKYFDVFWIPFFPVGKYSISSCSHCKAGYYDKDYDHNMMQKVLEIKKNTKTPLKYYSGLLLAGFVILGCVVMAISVENKTQEYINDPQKGDIYRYYDDEEKSYSTMQVFEVGKDSVYFHLNNFVIEKKSKVYSIDKPENYDTIHSYSYSKKELKDYFKKEIVYEINR